MGSNQVSLEAAADSLEEDLIARRVEINGTTPIYDGKDGAYIMVSRTSDSIGTINAMPRVWEGYNVSHQLYSVIHGVI